MRPWELCALDAHKRIDTQAYKHTSQSTPQTLSSLGQSSATLSIELGGKILTVGWIEKANNKKGVHFGKKTEVNRVKVHRAGFACVSSTEFLRKIFASKDGLHKSRNCLYKGECFSTRHVMKGKFEYTHRFVCYCRKAAHRESTDEGRLPVLLYV